eukprot:CAMPEP_0181087402 /NCGR_PEP_ID=MMETSP1071-20121207/6252_1 /TAXON_ID=35127 /ORGANISM="Thalassiosira sp., Strain NH16" /LENGTH=132 /DNA_ID=CAMNT_0023169285 /DNA_START=42 /DNA_END=440 /DNA_ORIENTATION=-
MKFLLLKSTALAVIVSSSVYARDEPSSALRGSNLAGPTDQFEDMQSDVCSGDENLSSRKRGKMPKSQVCRKDYGSSGQIIPYRCEYSPGYACCKSSAGNSVATQWGTCTKSSGEEEEDHEIESNQIVQIRSN